MKLKRQRFETVSDIRRKSQAVLDSREENDFHSVLKCAEHNTVYMPRESILREMAATI
jgi:hypothetical protein